MQAMWHRYPNFSKREFDCKATGNNEMDHDFMERLQKLRSAVGRPMRISSGYRDPSHPIEARKVIPGAHSTGKACDIACLGVDAYQIVALAHQFGFTGIGVQQKGDERFIHLDTLTPSEASELGVNRPWIWSY